jgi:tetratricopeptide (TPR) repeat protein
MWLDQVMTNRLLALFVGTLTLASICGTGKGFEVRPQSAPAHTREAKKYIALNDLDRARSELSTAIRIDPAYGEAYDVLGQLDLQTGNIEGAISAFTQAVKLQPKSFSSHYGLAMAFLQKHDIQQGLPELRTAVSLRPADFDANYNLGVLLLDEGRATEAIEHLRSAQAPGESRPQVAYNLIRAELAANRLDEARGEARKAAKSLDSNFKWKAAVGQMFLQQHQLGDAIPYLSQAHDLRPDSVEVRQRLATAYLESNQPGMVLDLVRDPQTAEDYYLLAGANYLLRHYELAAKNATTAVHMDSSQPGYLLLAARIDQHLGQHDSALSLLQNAIKQAPKWADPYYSAGVSLYCEKRYAEAQKYLGRSLELQPDSARALFLYAVSLVGEGNEQEGENYLRKAVALNPRNAHFQYYLGEILIRQNRLSDAEEVDRQAIRSDPKYAPLHYQLGKVLLRSDHPDQSARETEKAISLDPNLAEAYYQLMQAYSRLGEKEKSARAAAIFARLKKEPASDKEKFYEDVKKELGLP